MSAPDLSLLDQATFKTDPRREYTGPIPPKVAEIVKQLIAEGGQCFIPSTDEKYRQEMARIFAKAAKNEGMQARVWKDKSGKGFNVSVGSDKIGRKPDAADADIPDDDEED